MDIIYFFYPSKVVGGAEHLFARLALYLQENYNIIVYYIDYEDGYIKNNKKFQKIKFIKFIDHHKTVLETEGILITPISNIYRITDYIDIKNNNLKLFLWSIHPYNLIHITPEAYVLQNFSAKNNKYILKYMASNTYNVLRKMLMAFNKENAIYYMDYENYIFNYTIWGSCISKNFLKIASEEKSIFATKNIININEINIAVLGRLCEEKITSVINIIDNLNNLKTTKKKRIHIIGNGKFKDKIIITKYISIEIIFIETLLNKELDKYLIQNIDIIFSMGTCCLEGAALKLPVVVIPYSYKPYKLDQFYMFGDIEQYDIGVNINTYKNYANNTFEYIIHQVYDNSQKEILGKKCYDYFIRHYSLHIISKILLQLLRKDSLTFKKYFELKNKIGNFRKNKNILYKLLEGYIYATK